MAAAALNRAGADSKFAVATAGRGSLCLPQSTQFPTHLIPLSCPKLQLLPEIRSSAGLEVSRGPTASSPVEACSQRIGGTPSGYCPTISGLNHRRPPRVRTVSQPEETSASLENLANRRLMESPTRGPGGDPLRCWVQCHRGRSGKRCRGHRRLPAELREAPPASAQEPGASPTPSPRLPRWPRRRQGFLSLRLLLGA